MNRIYKMIAEYQATDTAVKEYSDRPDMDPEEYCSMSEARNGLARATLDALLNATKTGEVLLILKN